mmetsp:Transcript_24123/g.36847  ORF Transcript_24123/g.36847 Transcript_24123/m.36847 type:complete len:430 (+) Transcript_24123:301-1590(+)
MMICVAHDVSSQIKCARDCVSINRLLTLKVNPTTLDYGVSEVIPGELVGRWEGLQADVGTDGTVTASAPVELCATEGSPQLNIKLNDDDASLEIQMIKQVVCTGLYLGYFFSGVQGKNQCNKFVLDPDSNDAELTLTSHYENKLYDCSPLDKPGSMLKIETFSSVGNQIGKDAWLCQPRLPPAEIVGKWDGIKKLETGEDGQITECAVQMTASLTSSGLTMATSETCDQDESRNTQVHVFHAQVDSCTTQNGNTESRGTLLAYSTEGREYCYRFIRRSADNSLRMSYQTTRYPQRKHHVCPDEVAVSRDVAVLDMDLTSVGVMPSKWLCNDPQQGLPLASGIVDDDISGKDDPQQGIPLVTEIVDDDISGKASGTLVALLSILAILLVAICCAIIYKIKNRRSPQPVANRTFPELAEGDNEFDGTREIA